MAKTPGQNNNQEEGTPDLDQLLSDLKKKQTKKHLDLAEAIRHQIQRVTDSLSYPFC